MPHDKNGREVRKGDRVAAEFVVEEVWPSDDACNVSLRTPGEHGPRNVSSSITLNANQVEVVGGD